MNDANQQYDVSVVICTYNRCDMLPAALESVLAQETEDLRYELIVVDNNSKDRTREVVEALIKRGNTHLRYMFEGKQGKPYALNTGIANSHAPIIAFTDDDVRVAKDWVQQIKKAFDEHPEVDLVSGKVLPLWERTPPDWLTRDHWAPIAVQDYGDQSFYSNAKNPVCLIGANMSVRKDVFAQVGNFNPAFGRIGASSTEDHEWQLRLWRAGKQGIYVPEIVVAAEVQANRLTKAYHRLWHTEHGKSAAMMRLREIAGPDGALISERHDSATLFGAAAYIYKDLIVNVIRWLSVVPSANRSLSLERENEVREVVGYIRHRYAEHSSRRKHSVLFELASFAKSMLRRKVHGVSA